MIINTGCRTDIPAFYSKWLMNRIREGYVLVRNPFCKYCYANANKGLVIENMKKHNENSPFLIGNSEVGDKLTEAKQKSWIVSENKQISFI